MASDPELASHATEFVRRATATPVGTTSLPVSEEVRGGWSRRLGWLALTYSGAYALVYGTQWVRMLAAGQTDHSYVADVAALLSIALGIVVFLVARRACSPESCWSNAVLGNLALGFQVVAAIGIMAGAWGWETHFDLYQRHVWDALRAPGSYPQDFVQRMTAAQMRIVYLEGVNWVGVWLLTVPILVPLGTRRALLGIVLTVSTVPGILAASLLMHGTPASLEPWTGALLLDSAVPVAICGAIAFFGSRTVYRLSRDLSRAQQIGSYELVSCIGEGGMGEVWHARHQLLARPAAIKLIRPDFLGAPGSELAREALRRFEREAQATAMLHSPHTIELYDFGISSDGRFYYVMELLDGFDLKTLVTRFGPVPAPRAIHLLQQVCHSLEDAHRMGLVHRDVKPSNIFTCRHGLDLDFVKVLDFGLVKAMESGAQNVELSAVGLTRGTPAFMAPETALGSPDVDPRSDLYALGCVAYWLVSGELVFNETTPVGMLLKHAKESPVPPSQRIGRPLPPAFEDLVLRCLHKDPQYRPASAAILSEELAACAQTCEPWTPRHAEQWWIQHAPSRMPGMDPTKDETSRVQAYSNV